jgi:hypothetical protein
MTISGLPFASCKKHSPKNKGRHIRPCRRSSIAWNGSLGPLVWLRICGPS